MYAKEAEIVNEDFLAEENTYNLKVGGFGGWDYLNNPDAFYNHTHSLEYCRKISPFGSKKFITIGQLTGTFSKGGKRSKELGVGIHDPKHRASFAGKQHTDDTKLKISQSMLGKQNNDKNSQFGTMWVTDGINNMKIKNDLTIPIGYRRGRVMKKVNQLGTETTC